ncbi:MAG: cation diffusion facilitator family transporter [Bacilli bacterium]|nr:cation diffusion facilitator family transporter [Bacilli bacterium]
MVTLLRRLFVKDYQNVSDVNVRSAHGVLAAWWGIITNTLLAGGKLAAAIILASSSGGALSIALIADAVNNLSDIASSVVTLVGFSLAKKPADAGHPFGHRRIEYVAGLVVAVLVVAAAMELFGQSLSHAFSGQEVIYDAATLVVMGIAVAGKLLQGYVNIGISKAISSVALKATAVDSFTDAAATFALLVGGIFAFAFQRGNLDAYLGMGISFFVGFSGVRMIIEEANPLIGLPNSAKELGEIESLCLAHKEALSVHDVILHNYGPGVNFLSLHVEVDEHMSLKKAHALADAIETEISERFSFQATVHIDPVSLDDPKRQEIAKRVKALLEGIDPSLSFHDLRLLTREGKSVLQLDVQAPFGFKGDEQVKEALSPLADTLELSIDHPYAE